MTHTFGFFIKPGFVKHSGIFLDDDHLEVLIINRLKHHAKIIITKRSPPNGTKFFPLWSTDDEALWNSVVVLARNTRFGNYNLLSNNCRDHTLLVCRRVELFLNKQFDPKPLINLVENDASKNAVIFGIIILLILILIMVL